jgi:hypothetical protein
MGLAVLMFVCHGVAEEKPLLFVGKSAAEVYQIVHRAKWQVDADTVLACTSRRVAPYSERRLHNTDAGAQHAAADY